jgi:hypothetical protein
MGLEAREDLRQQTNAARPSREVRFQAARVLLEAGVLCAVALASWHFATEHILRNIVHPPAAIGRLIDGTGETPYQYRILIPTIVGWIQRSGIFEPWIHSRREVARLVEVLALIGLYYATRALLGCFVPRAASAICAFSLFYVLPFQYVFPRNWPFWYTWDIPAVMFFTLGMLLIRQRRWWVYYPVFVLATLNRETTCFLALLQLCVSWDQGDRRTLVAHIAAQAALFIAIRYALHMAFRDNRGVGLYYERAVADNIATMSQLRNWQLVFSNFGYLWLLLCIGYRFIREPFARRALWIAPVLVPSVFFGAVFDELRVFGELIPVILVGVV